MTRLFPSWTHLVLVLGAVTLVVGVVVAVTAPPVSVGWFAYAPLSDRPVIADPPTNWRLLTGVAVAVVGALATAFAAGRLSVRRPD
ncbi:hypothetical protein [Curtobacterium sp. 9128]|uniref:hypothetical protein n=1 Tax=Curtobacterium sp. 9128 TaxID=1793722 RepID=UPI0011A408DA|nr:hypothetical protein [Curtobacterium sp. 9128]